MHLGSQHQGLTNHSNHIHVTVVVCTFNPNKQYLTRTLQSLAAQTLPKSAWELILVDNNSDSPLAPMYPVNWHPNARWLHEPQQGKVAAMKRGFQTATGDLIITIDDDNLPSPDYLEEALNIHLIHPYLGVFGSGKTEAEYEGDLPSGFHAISGFLAIRNIDHTWIQNTIGGGYRPWGLGLCISRDVMTDWLLWCTTEVTEYLTTLGRKATTLEDDIFSLLAVQRNLAYGIFPDLRLTHLISGSRLDISYLSSLAYDSGYSHALFTVLCGESPSNPYGPGSAKAALMLLLERRYKLAREELQRLFAHSRESSESKKLRVCRVNGWEACIQSLTSLQMLGTSKNRQNRRERESKTQPSPA